jgi:hypothetical protein
LERFWEEGQHYAPLPRERMSHDSQLLDLAADKYRDNCSTSFYRAYFSKRETLYKRFSLSI